MSEIEEAISVEYKIGRAEMKNEITTFIEEMSNGTLTQEDDGSDFFKNKMAIVAALISLNNVIKKNIEI